MIDFKHKRAQIATVVVLIIAITALREAVGQSGPLYLIPVVIAALWLGRWAGLATGIVGSLLVLGGTTDVSGSDAPDSTLFADLMRVLVYSGLGYVVGALSERRFGLERELLRRELELEELRTLQDALAPSEPPERPALELATCYIPAEQGVSGDFHVVVPAADGSTLIAVGDVAGRGLEAAKRAWYVRTLLLSSADITTDPSTVLERANRALIDDSGFDAPFVTVACVLFHTDGSVDWALAGHDGPMRLDSGDPLRSEGRSGLPLGVAERVGCETSTATLAADGGLLLYTDGLTEARRGESDGSFDGFELFGERRVAAALSRLDGSPSTDVLNEVRDEVQAFSGGALADDLCMIALRVTPDPDATEVCAPDRVEVLSAELSN